MLKKIVPFFLLLQLVFEGINAQNSIVGDGFGGRLWYKPANYSIGSYSAYTICDNQLYGWGSNLYYNLGNATNNPSATPIAATGMTNVKFYTVGYIMGAIKNDNTGWIWGYNGTTEGGWATADAGTPGTDLPQQVITNVKYADGGVKTLVFTKYDGTVWNIGVNKDGEFGNGTTSNTNTQTPSQMTGVTTAVRAVSGGYYGTNNDPHFTIVLLSNGTVLQCGGAGSVLGTATSTATAVPGLTNVVDIKANAYAAYALTSSGDVYSWGYNAAYALGTSAAINTQVTTPTKVTFPSGAGTMVSISSINDGGTIFALDENKNAYGWGFNSYGQLGIANTSNQATPVLVNTNVIDIMSGETFAYLVKADATMWASGSTGNANSYGYDQIWMDLSNAQRTSWTQITPTGSPMNLCPPVTLEVLPLQWLTVSGKVNSNKQALLSFKVNETNVAKYEIEKSSDGRTFYSIANINSKGYGENMYQFTEATPLNGVKYYRIKQIDADGRYSYSTIIKLTTYNSSLLSVFPNPAKNVIAISGAKLGTKLVLTDLSGKILQQITVTATSFSIDISKYSSGMYVLKTDDGVAQKIIKE